MTVCLQVYCMSLCVYRSTAGDSVQLVEQSLDTNLLNNAIRLQLSHCKVLPGGVVVQETLSNVIILVSTNQSVHRLVLPHPTRMYRSVSDTHTHYVQHCECTHTDMLNTAQACFTMLAPPTLTARILGLTLRLL